MHSDSASSPLLSVIVPVYKVADTLNRCIQSIVGQDYSALEILLIDDGSPDNCPQLCDAWAEKDERIVVIHQANCGLSHTRNTGIIHSNGEYITFVDSDDTLAENTYGKLMARMCASKSDILEYSARTDIGSPQESVLTLADKRYTTFEDYWFGSEAYLHCFAWNKIFHRRLFENIRFREGKLFEDVFILPELVKAANTVITTSEGCYHYYANPKGISKQLSSTLTGDHLAAHMTIMPSLIHQYRAGNISKKDMSRYYIYVMNIQLVHSCLTREECLVPRFRPCLITGSGMSTLIKSILLQVISPKLLCRLMRRFVKRRL